MLSALKLNLEAAVISLYDGVRVGHGLQPQVRHLVTKTPLVPAKNKRLECAAIHCGLKWASVGFELSEAWAPSHRMNFPIKGGAKFQGLTKMAYFSARQSRQRNFSRFFYVLG